MDIRDRNHQVKTKSLQIEIFKSGNITILAACLFHKNHFDSAKLREFSVAVGLEGAKGFFSKTILRVEAGGNIMNSVPEQVRIAVIQVHIKSL